jgi:hypothetical protein
MNRRALQIGCVLVFVTCLPVRAQDKRPDVVKIRIDCKRVLGPISPGFIGFGYETSAVAQANYFSDKNATLVRLYRNLSSRGLVRIGGNISDHAKYVADGAAAVRSEKSVTVINRANLLDFAAFLQATGWKAMWGLNLGTGSRQEAAQEAVAVEGILADHLHSFEIGNEVDLHSGYKPVLKDYPAYHAAYLDYKAAIRAALPRAAFSGPDAGGNYVSSFAASEARDMKLLTTHYYRGWAGDPKSTIEKLLQPDEGWEQRSRKLQQIGKENNLSFRINEVNSFSGGGKPGVSDTFASALWCLDYMFRLASYGCDGVNMETDINQLAFISHYSPIVHDAAGHCSARPEYYGMLAFAMAGKGDLLKIELEKSDINLTAYAAKDEKGSLGLTVINKDLSRDARVEVSLPNGFATAGAFRLTAPAVESKTQITFAGKEVSADGTWTPGAPENVVIKDGNAHCSVAHASAVVLRIRR